MTTDVRFKDFSTPNQPVSFQVDGDLFEAPAVLPVPVMQELVVTADKLKNIGEDASVFTAMIEIFDVILVDASAARFRERVNSKTEPIGMQQIVDIMLWLLEAYGLRPTQPSSDSLTGALAEMSGTPSVAGAPSAG